MKKRGIFDPALKESNAVRLYRDRKFIWWFEETSAEFLADHYSNLGPEVGDRGIAAFKTALKIDPGSYQAHLGLGAAYVNRGKLDLAFAELKTVSKSTGLEIGAFHLGLAYAKQGKPKLAEAEYKIALRIQP